MRRTRNDAHLTHRPIKDSEEVADGIVVDYGTRKAALSASKSWTPPAHSDRAQAIQVFEEA